MTSHLQHRSHIRFVSRIRLLIVADVQVGECPKAISNPARISRRGPDDADRSPARIGRNTECVSPAVRKVVCKDKTVVGPVRGPLATIEGVHGADPRQGPEGKPILILVIVWSKAVHSEV